MTSSLLTAPRPPGDPRPSAPSDRISSSRRPLVVRLVLLVVGLGDALIDRLSCALRSLRRSRHDDRGQATTEYALVLLAAALVALLVIAWATAGGGAARVSRLFNRVIDAVIDRV